MSHHSKSLPKTKKQIVVCPAEEIAPGKCKIVKINNKSIGIFNVNGNYHALLNYCPHKGGELCAGPVTGTSLPTDKTEFVYGYENALIRCAWHGWEFEIASGKCLLNPKVRVKSYPVTIDGNNKVTIQIW